MPIYILKSKRYYILTNKNDTIYRTKGGSGTTITKENIRKLTKACVFGKPAYRGIIVDPELIYELLYFHNVNDD